MQGEKVLTGVWEATPREMHSIKGTIYEFCHVISGYVTLRKKMVRRRPITPATAS
jgi:uncharacterized cupin superfamily protein